MLNRRHFLSTAVAGLAATTAFRRRSLGSTALGPAILRLLWWLKSEDAITLSRDLLAGIDRLAGLEGFTIASIERVLRRYLRTNRIQAHARDLERINPGCGCAGLRGSERSGFSSGED